MAAAGYDPRFLGTEVAPPQAPASGPGDDPALATPLDYVHFTVRMHPERRLAWWVAWNVDGLRLFPGDSISRSGERFRLDPRIPADAQTGEAVYAANDLDRGHVARRSDLLWGTLDEARLASSASFCFTNITPQHQDFNQSGRGGVWGLLENAVLELEGLTDRRLTLFAGPVLHPDDPPYRGIQLPVEHWKVVVYRLDGRLRAKAFVLTQDLDDLERAARDFLDDFETWLVPLEVLEERTGLTFASLRDAVAPEELVHAGPVLVTDAEEVGW
jgi:endonuclease G